MDFYSMTDTGIVTEIGSRIKSLRLRKNLTQQQVSEATALSLNAIKSLEEADDKLKKATVLELAAVEMQKNAARSRDESRDILTETVVEREKLEYVQRVQGDALKQKEDELRNREVTLEAEQADLVNRTAERVKELDLLENGINVTSVAIDKSLRRNEEQEEELGLLRDKYKSIAEFITNTL